MAALPLRLSWSPPATVVAASRCARPIRGAMHVHPLCRQGPSSAPVKMETRTRDAFRFHCQKRADHHPEPEPEQEQELEDDDADMVASSENDGFDLVEKVQRYQKAFRAMLGGHVAADMFLQEKDQISNYMLKISSSGDLGNVNARVVAETVCARARTALDVASKVMDIADLGLGTTEISQHTAHQMVRTYAAIFCNVAEDAYHMKIEMETIQTFLGALRGLGAICHILVQDTVTKLKDGPLKNNINRHMDTHSQEFDKKMNTLEDEIAKIKTVTKVLYDGLQYARSYIFRLVKCHKTALQHLT
uniref:Uncharacterized protein n=1 Tax=Arundo donax TaxID=35708 RepID=A0A0A9D583_ARUDO